MARRTFANDEERKAAQREHVRRYMSSPKGRALNRERSRRFNNSPEGRIKNAAYRRKTRAQQKLRYDAWMAALKADPVRYAAWMQKKIAKQNRTHYASSITAERYRKNVKANPEKYSAQIERRRAACYARYLVMRADPARYDAFKAGARLRNARRREQKRLRTDPKYAMSMYANIMRMIPRSLHEELRGEVCNDIIADILAGKITVEQVPKVLKPYLTAARKTMHSDYEFDSLDDVIPGTDSLKRVDTIDSRCRIYDATPYKR